VLLRKGWLEQSRQSILHPPKYSLTTSGKETAQIHKPSLKYTTYEKKKLTQLKENEKKFVAQKKRVLEYMRQYNYYPSIEMICSHTKLEIHDVFAIMANLKSDKCVRPLCNNLLWQLTPHSLQTIHEKNNKKQKTNNNSQ